MIYDIPGDLIQPLMKLVQAVGYGCHGSEGLAFTTQVHANLLMLAVVLPGTFSTYI